MTDSDFRLALSIALAINAGRDPIGSIQFWEWRRIKKRRAIQSNLAKLAQP